MEGEANTRYWYQLNKESNPPSIIMALTNEQNKTQTKLSEMTKIATEYHQNLQKAIPNSPERNEAINNILNNITTSLNQEQKHEITKEITKEDIKTSMKKAQNGKTPGKDGLPYEFYKLWTKQNIDIIEILQEVYLDIQNHGTFSTNFSTGVMSLLYKKKDKRKIENYRPITLLNTDYKIMTRIIASRLGKIAPTLIHPDQAGFIPGRNLYNHTRLTSLMIDYCETVEINGCIIALDQEKAYDKIAHDYLWKTLKKYNFPESFINLIKTLYTNSKTHIMVNGFIPEPITINRGVRQGDPMACLLYNLAIEPLAAAIRNNKKLKGIQIPKHKEPTKVTLFTDDTLIYTTITDDINELDKIIECFCKASTAKFNVEKTEFLPIGTKKYRTSVINTNKINETYTIPKEHTIIKDSTPMRTLGAWVGNRININTQWNTIINKQQKIIDSWKQNHLTFRGKELLLKSLIQSRSLFLATVNGMPKHIEEQINTMTRNYLWNEDRRGLITMNQASLNIQDGGLNIPNLSARLEAIEIIWLKKWLQPQNCPAWALLTDEIIRKKHITQTHWNRPKMSNIMDIPIMA